jgi:hypothetical protein
MPAAEFLALSEPRLRAAPRYEVASSSSPSSATSLYS